MPIPQNGQIHSNNSSAKADKLFDHLWGWRVKGQGKITVNDMFLTELEHKKIIFKKLKSYVLMVATSLLFFSLLGVSFTDTDDSWDR